MGITFEVLHIVFNWPLLSNGATIYPFETYMLASMYVIIISWKSNICKQKWNGDTEYFVCTSRLQCRDSWYSNIVCAVVRLIIHTEIEVVMGICALFFGIHNLFTYSLLQDKKWKAKFHAVIIAFYSLLYRMFKTSTNAQCGGWTITCLPINVEVVDNNCLSQLVKCV